MDIEIKEGTQEYLCPEFNVVDTTERKTIVVYGSGSAVIGRWYDSAFKNIQSRVPNVEFIGVDLQDNPKLSATHFPWVGYYDARKFNSAVVEAENSTIHCGDRDITVDGVIVAIPPKDHLEIAKLWVSKAPVLLEKPIVMPYELNELQQLVDRYPNRIFAADCFMDSDAFQFVLRNKTLLESIGNLVMVNGRLVESNPIEAGREWLLDPAIGGGGLGMDILPHLGAITHNLLQRLGVTEKMQVRQATLGKYITDSGEPLIGEGETYMNVHGQVGNILFSLEGGKGVDTIYYGITLEGTKGVVEIMNGTDEYPPYVQIIPKEGSTQVYTFPTGGVGYEGLLLDFMAFVYGSDVHCGASIHERLEASVNAVRVIRDAYIIASPEVISYRIGTGPQPAPLGSRRQVPSYIERKTKI